MRTATRRLATPLLLLSLAGCGGSDQQAACPARFDTAAWRAALQDGSDSARLRLARQVVRCHFVKPGDTKGQVRRLLGRPPRDEPVSRSAAEWRYLLGMTNNVIGPGMDHWLVVEFNLRVNRVYIDSE